MPSVPRNARLDYGGLCRPWSGVESRHTQLCASFLQAAAQDLSSAVESSYPTDELSHPEYVNDDFRMFTFKVGGVEAFPVIVNNFCVIALHLTQFFVYALCICCFGTDLVSPAFGVA